MITSRKTTGSYPRKSFRPPTDLSVIMETYFIERMKFQTQALIYNINQPSLMMAEY